MTDHGSSTPTDLAARCQPIELLVADVDGVLTDGVIAVNDSGIETKHFSVRDGMATRYGTARESRRRSFLDVGRRPSIAGPPS